MIANTKCPPPYEWLLGAIDEWAVHNDCETRNGACCELLHRGLGRDLGRLVVLRTFPQPRGGAVTKARKPAAGGVEIPAFSVTGPYLDLYDRIEEAVATLRARHIERSKSGVRKLVKTSLSGVIGARGWRAEVPVGQKSADSVVVQLVGDVQVPDEVLRDVCDVVTDEMTSADVRRAIWAAELELDGFAPKSWADRVVIGKGWLRFEDRVVADRKP